MRYHVTWDIDVHADSPEAAAREAPRIQRDPGSIATVFDVFPEPGGFCRVDLQEIDENENKVPALPANHGSIGR